MATLTPKHTDLFTLSVSLSVYICLYVSVYLSFRSLCLLIYLCQSLQLDEEHMGVEVSSAGGGGSGVALPPLGLKRKADTPLGSPPEPGQVLHPEEEVSRGRHKIRVSCTNICIYLFYFLLGFLLNNRNCVNQTQNIYTTGDGCISCINRIHMPTLIHTHTHTHVYTHACEYP